MGHMKTRGSPRATCKTAGGCWRSLGFRRRVLGRAHGVVEEGEDLGGQSPNDGVFRVHLLLYALLCYLHVLIGMFLLSCQEPIGEADGHWCCG